MSRKKKNKPSAPRKLALSPEEQAAKAEAEARAEEERRQERAENRRVRAMPGGRVVKDPRTGKVTARQIEDIADLMSRTKDGDGRPLIGPEETGAVRTLERMIEKAGGGSGSCLSTLERVNGQSSGDPTLASVIRHTEAAKDLKKRQERMGPRTWSLLRELCDGNLTLTRWHGVIQRHTGETGQKQQGAILRQAFRELASVERDIHRSRAANDTDPHDVALTG